MRHLTRFTGKVNWNSRYQKMNEFRKLADHVNRPGLVIADFSDEMLKKLVILTAVISTVIFFFAAQFLIRDDFDSDQKLAIPVKEKSIAGSVGYDKPQESKGRIQTTSVAESDMAKGFKRPIWAKLDAEREKYQANFVRDITAISNRGIWRNSKQVRFWTDLLASDDPELAAQAIQIIEGSTWEKAGVLGDLKGSDKNGYTPEEWESNQIFTTLLKARGGMYGARNSLPTETAIRGGDTDDSLILKDAQCILKTFVPRLKDPDPATAAAAKSVVNLFTYDLFRDEPSEWWEAHIHDEAGSGSPGSLRGLSQITDIDCRVVRLCESAD